MLVLPKGTSVKSTRGSSLSSGEAGSGDGTAAASSLHIA